MDGVVSDETTVAVSARAGAGTVRRTVGWVGVVLMVPVAAYLMLVPAYVWGSAVVGGLIGPEGSFSARGSALALVVALLPTVVAVLTWRATRTHPVRTERLILALVVGCAIGLLTSLPFLPMLALPF